MEAGFESSVSAPLTSPTPDGDTRAKGVCTGTVLIVDDDPELAEAIIAPNFQPTWKTRCEHDLAGALAALDEIDELCAAIIDLHLPPRNGVPMVKAKSLGFEVVERARCLFPAAPVIVFTGYVNPSYVNTAHRLGAEYLVKGDSIADLQRLASRFLLNTHPQPCRATAFVARLREAHALSHRQTQVVTLALRGLQNNEIAAALGISVNTLKRHVAAALDKCSEPSLSSITRRFLRGD